MRPFTLLSDFKPLRPRASTTSRYRVTGSPSASSSSGSSSSHSSEDDDDDDDDDDQQASDSFSESDSEEEEFPVAPSRHNDGRRWVPPLTINVPSSVHGACKGVEINCCDTHPYRHLNKYSSYTDPLEVYYAKEQQKAWVRELIDPPTPQMSMPY